MLKYYSTYTRIDCQSNRYHDWLSHRADDVSGRDLRSVQCSRHVYMRGRDGSIANWSEDARERPRIKYLDSAMLKKPSFRYQKVVSSRLCRPTIRC